jgi:hypothetical protein
MGKKPTPGKVRAEDAGGRPAKPETKPKRLVERVNRCQFCNREMNVPGDEYAENPFCAECLPERMGRSGGHPTPPIGTVVAIDVIDGIYPAIIVGYNAGGAIVEDARGRTSIRPGLDMPKPGTALYRAAQLLARDRSWLSATPATIPEPADVRDVLNEIYKAGGKAWDDVADPDAEIIESRRGPEVASPVGGPLSDERIDARLQEHEASQGDAEDAVDLTAAGEVAAGTILGTLGENPDKPATQTLTPAHEPPDPYYAALRMLIQVENVTDIGPWWPVDDHDEYAIEADLGYLFECLRTTLHQLSQDFLMNGSPNSQSVPANRPFPSYPERLSANLTALGRRLDTNGAGDLAPIQCRRACKFIVAAAEEIYHAFEEANAESIKFRNKLAMEGGGA